MKKLSPRQREALGQIANLDLAEAIPVFRLDTIQALMRRGLIARESDAGGRPIAFDAERLVATPAGRAALSDIS